jgi:hypothetical protein
MKRACQYEACGVARTHVVVAQEHKDCAGRVWGSRYFLCRARWQSIFSSRSYFLDVRSGSTENESPLAAVIEPNCSVASSSARFTRGNDNALAAIGT